MLKGMESNYKVEVYGGSETNIFGKSYGEWTVLWWKWLLSVPAAINPLVDNNGQHAAVGQPSYVWFLAGSFPNYNREYPYRKTQVPVRRSILFPVINCEANELEYPHLKSESDVLEHVKKDMNSIVKKDCFINGKRIIPQRVPSDPQIFPLTIPDNNVIGVRGGNTSAASDGYWVFLKPLSKGQYTVRFEGSCELGRLNSGVIYELEIF